MKRRRHTPEQIIRKLAEGDKLLAEGKSIDEVCRHLEITESTWHRWRNQFGGMKAEDAKELKELQRENQRLKKIVADQALDIEMLKELNQKNGDPERSTPGGAMPERRLRGLRTTCLSAARPAPVHPTSCPPVPGDDELALRAFLRDFSKRRPRWGWRRAARAARDAGWRVNDKRIHRLWRAEGLRVPYRKRKRPLRGIGVAVGALFPDPARRGAGHGLPVRPDLRWQDPQASERDRRVQPGVPGHRHRAFHRR